MYDAAILFAKALNELDRSQVGTIVLLVLVQAYTNMRVEIIGSKTLFKKILKSLELLLKPGCTITLYCVQVKTLNLFRLCRLNKVKILQCLNNMYNNMHVRLIIKI